MGQEKERPRLEAPQVTRNKARLREIAKIDRLEAEAWETWERSKQADCLSIILWCIDARCKLCGLYGTSATPKLTGEYSESDLDFWTAKAAEEILAERRAARAPKVRPGDKT